MSNMNALGYLMDYCNRNSHIPGIQDKFNRFMGEIMSSPEGRFRDCNDVSAVLRELHWDK